MDASGHLTSIRGFLMSDLTLHLREPRPFPARISIVIPCYNEEPVIPFLRRELTAFLNGLPCDSEVVLVNDGSRDDTLALAVEWAVEDSRIRVLQLSRNFGQDVATTAGLDYCSGDAVVLMDADLQDPLPVVHRMIEQYCAGYDVVYGEREKRAGESPFKLLSAWLFYRLMRLLAYRDLPADVGNFRLISRPCLCALSKMRESHRFLRGMIAWVGYPQTSVVYRRQTRVAGVTKYSLGKMLMFAWTAAVSFSTTPLNLSFVLGGVLGAFGIEEACRAVLAHFMGWYVIPGWTSLMVVTSLIGSCLLISLGILGQYVARIYEQAKDRPLYFVSRTYGVSAACGAVREVVADTWQTTPALRGADDFR
jgi:glycosyltransferase involved in cell wall biosynthesis